MRVPQFHYYIHPTSCIGELQFILVPFHSFVSAIVVLGSTLAVNFSVCNLSRLMTKLTKWHGRPAKNRISLGIHPVWSESLLSAWWKLGPLATHWAHSKDSDQTGWMSRVIRVFAGRTYHFVGCIIIRLFLFVVTAAMFSQFRHLNLLL